MLEQNMTGEKKGNYLSGAVGAILGALLGAVPWAIAYYFGWFVGWIGFLIGIFAFKGYNIFRGKFGWPTVFIVIFATIFGVVAGQIMGDFFDIAKLIANGEIDWITYSDIPKLYFAVLSNSSEVLTTTLFNLGLGLVFACLGIWRIIKNMISDLKAGNYEYSAQINSETY